MSSVAVARFGGSVLDNLEARIGGNKPGVALAIRLRLDLIDQDPQQPRVAFDPDALERLAASIRMVGVLQPVGVVPASAGRYLLRWGARRLRAAMLAGLADIPAVLVGSGQAGLEAQVIENRHRADNTDMELAAAIATLTARGMSNVDIATVLAVSDPQSLKYYRALPDMAEQAPPLAAWLDRAPARALYEVRQVYHKATDEQRQRIADALAAVEELTVAEARRVIAAALDREPPPRPFAQPAPDVVPAVAARPARAERPDVVADCDAERVAAVRAWLADTTRPRPALSV